MKNAIGFIGLGNMGNPMAARLLAAGYQLIVFDNREKAVSTMVDRGAKSAQSPESVASQTDTILMSLPTPEVVKNVALGANGIIAGSKIKPLVDLSTTGPHVAQELAKILS